MYYDRMSPGEMLDQHQFRTKRFNHLFLCNDCVRSFDTTEEVGTCKFCNSTNVRKISDHRPEKVMKKQLLRYYCPSCERNFISEDKVESCKLCGRGRLHFYKWDRVWFRDWLRTRIAKIIGNVKKIPHRTRKIRTEKVNPMQPPVNADCPQTAQNPVVIRKVYTMRLPRFSFSRNKEEMPSR